MARQLIRVPPTRNSLLNLKRHVAFLEQGHSLLERKRELLTRLVYQRLAIYRERRREACDELRDAYHWLSIVEDRVVTGVPRFPVRSPVAPDRKKLRQVAHSAP